MKKNKEVESQPSQAEDAFIAAEEQWQEEFEADIRTKEELRKEGARMERERIKEKMEEVLGSIGKKQKGQLVKRDETFKIIRIDIQMLVTEIEKMKFFDSSYEAEVLAWFRGIPPEAAIPVDVSATMFVSLIADLMDTRPKFIKNSKEFVYKYIESSFLFNGKPAKASTIRYYIM